MAPLKSIAMHGSSLITRASWPGGITPASPGPNSHSFPSSILTYILPEITYAVWYTRQLSAFAIGFANVDHSQPGSTVAPPGRFIVNICDFNFMFFKIPRVVKLHGIF